MRERPSVSVVIPVLNGAGTISGTLRALQMQVDAPPHTEIIVVDNGSTDGTQAIVAQFSVMLLHENTRGAAAARNCGIRAASGDLIAHCDADTIPTRRWLTELVTAFEDPNVTLAAGRIMSYPPKTGAERYLAACGVYDVERASVRDPFPLAPSGNMAVRRAAALAVGCFDEAMITAEDADFCHRILRAYPGVIAYRAGALLFHRNRPSDDELRRQAWVYGEGVARMYRRYPEILPWNVGKIALVAVRTVWRAATPLGLAIGRRLKLATADSVEFSVYHRLWTWWFWCGFFRFYYGNRTFGVRP